MIQCLFCFHPLHKRNQLHVERTGKCILNLNFRKIHLRQCLQHNKYSTHIKNFPFFEIEILKGAG